MTTAMRIALGIAAVIGILAVLACIVLPRVDKLLDELLDERQEL